MTVPKISIIVPVFNVEQYLPRCIESILAQTYKNLEIILISDGSTDGTDEVIREYAKKDSRIIPIFKENSGVSDTRNRGLDIATGDYIGFVDGDDYIDPEMYETLLKNAIENNADISHCGYQMVFPSRVDYYYNTGKKVIQDNKKGIRDIIVGDYVEPGVWNKLYRADILKELRMPPDIKINEDVIFNFYAFVNSQKSVYEDIPYYYYLVRKGSAANSELNENQLFDPVKVRKMIYEYCMSNLEDKLKSIAYCSYLNSIMRLYRTVHNNSLNQYKTEAKFYREQIKKEKCRFVLSKRVLIDKLLFFHCTGLLMFIYNIYDKFLSKNTNKYEVK